jgi:hypothetical protein
VERPDERGGCAARSRPVLALDHQATMPQRTRRPAEWTGCSPEPWHARPVTSRLDLPTARRDLSVGGPSISPWLWDRDSASKLDSRGCDGCAPAKTWLRCAALLVQGEPQRVITRPTDRRPAPVAYFAAINLQAAAGPLRRARKRPSPTRCSGPQSRLLPVACVAALYSSGPAASRGNSAAGPEERRFLVPTGVGAFGTRPANCGPVCGVAASRKQPRVGPARRGISASEQAAEQTRRSDPGWRVPAPCG